MKKKQITRISVDDLKIKRKKINIKEVMKLIDKIGTPFDTESKKDGNYSTA